LHQLHPPSVFPVLLLHWCCLHTSCSYKRFVPTLSLYEIKEFYQITICPTDIISLLAYLAASLLAFKNVIKNGLHFTLSACGYGSPHSWLFQWTTTY
jgi:hypothetical protein